MKFTPLISLKPGLGGAAVIALGLALAASGCSDGGPAPEPDAAAGQPEAPAATDAAAAPEPASEPEANGEMLIDGETYALTKAYWCGPEPGMEGGTTVSLRVGAYDETGDVIVYGIQVDSDSGDSPTTRLSAATDPNTNYSSEGLGGTPTMEVQDGVVRLRGDVYRPGEDPVAMQAEFSLPAQPGFPGYC